MNARSSSDMHERKLNQIRPVSVYQVKNNSKKQASAQICAISAMFFFFVCFPRYLHPHDDTHKAPARSSPPPST